MKGPKKQGLAGSGAAPQDVFILPLLYIPGGSGTALDFALCVNKKKGWEAYSYNELIAACHFIVEVSHDVGHRDEQTGLIFKVESK